MTAATEFAFDRMRAEAPLRLLLVEDDPNDAELVHACLEEAARAGAEIVHAANLAEGLRALDAHEVHVTVLDLDLPDSSGVETLDRLLAAARGPVIVVTGNPHPGLASEALKRGAYDVLQKSELDARSLMRLVRLASLQSLTENSLWLTERRYRALIENSREAIALLGGGGELLFGNPALHAMLWRAANLIELAHPFEREALRAEYARLVATPDGRAILKAHFRHADGSWRMLEAALHNRLRDGGVAAVIANLTDITSHADLEERFRATFDQAAVGIAHVANDGRFQLVNRKLCEILGYSREELSALTAFDVSHPEDRDVAGALRRKMRAREIDSFCIIKRYQRKGGATVWVELTVSLVRAADGAPSYEIALFEDISARRQGEHALQRSERRFRALIENSSDGIMLADGEGRMTYGSPGARRTLGYAKGETLGLQVAELVHPDERAVFEQILASASARPGVTHALRVRARHKNGAYRLLEGTCTDLTGDESVRAILFNYRDITEREEAQARARRMSLMYAALSAANEASAQLKDEQELYQRICDIAVKLGGLKLAAMRLLQPDTQWLWAVASAGEPASYIAKTRISIDASIPEGQGLAALAMRENRTTVSNDFFAEPRLGPWWDAAREAALAAAACIPLRRGGRPSGLLVLYSGETGWFDAEVIALAERMAANLSHALDALDLDDARRASEQDLREGEERIRTIVDSANEGILVYDREHRIVAGNPAAARIIGVPVAEMIGNPGFTSLFPCVHEDGSSLAPDDRPTRLTLRTGPLTDRIVGIVRPGGATTWVSVNTAFLRRPGESEHYGLVSTIADVTAQRTAELALRESEDRFRKLTALSSDWYWEQDEEFRLTFMSSQLGEKTGLDPAAYLGRRRWDQPAFNLSAADWARHRAQLERHEPFRDFVMQRPAADGGSVWLSVSGEPVFDEAGRFKGYRGVGRDISESKRSEEALRRFRAALDASVDAIFLIDAGAMRMIDVNDAAARNLGYGRDELVGQSPSMLFTDRSDADLRAAYERLASQEGRTDVYRAHYRRKDGSLLPVEITRRIVCIGERSYVVSVARDISERLKTEERLEQSVERFEIVARATNDVVWDWNLITDQVWWNENFQKVFGYAPYEIGAYIDSWTSRIHPDEVGAVKQAIRGAIDRGDKAWSGEYRFQRKDGSFAHVLDRGLLIQDSSGRPVRMIGAMVDVTARKATERKLQLHAQRQEELARLGQFALREASLDEVFAEAVRVLQSGVCDVAAIIEQMNEEGPLRIAAARGGGAEASVGKSAPAAKDSKWRTAIEAAGAVLGDRAYFESRPADQPWAYWLRRMGSGVYVAIHGERGPFGFLTMNSLRDGAFDEEDLRFAEAVANVLSGTVRRHQTQTRLAYMAEFDGLTGLPNRNLLQDRLHQSVAQAQRRGWQGAVLFIDLDRFKLVNDTLGHHVGDALIAQVGQRLKRCVRTEDTVGRVSGDEFGVVLSDLAQADDAALVAQKILDALARPFDLGGNEAYVTASIGISVFPADGADAETLLKNADMAMYRAKELTRNAYCFFTGEMNQRSVAKLQLNTDLRRAIERREFVLHYQPKVDLRDRRLLGVEALLRWAHPSRGMVSPAEFIPALEDSGLILPVGEWVLEEASLQLRRWQLAGLATVPVAVNLSAKQFRRRDLDALIARALAAAGVAAGLIELEITESCLMEDPEDAVRLLASLRGAGLRISVDDFGTGYSSLSYLTRLPLNALKIDRSFVRDVVLNGEAASIVRAVIDMAHNLGFTVVAEGVETEQQVAFLRRHGCDLGQGYLFAPPVSAAELAGRLRRAA
jgi:diguanylate cyclase (GGDEF)-like protein/PAS domain S-box-containing protein